MVNRILTHGEIEMDRRLFLQLGTATLTSAAGARFASAQSYPARPVHIISGFPAGGLSDILARLLGQRLSERLGQAFIVENRPGAGTNIATEAVVHAPADGYTLLLATAMNAINVTVYDSLRFNYIRDMAPVASIVDAAFVLEVHPSVPATNLPEFVAYAKANPGKLAMASGGIGSPEHVAGELFKMMTGIDLLHVPYRGSAPALNDLVSGHVQVCFGPVAPSIQHLRAGTLRALAVTTARRSEALPDVPAVAEFIPGYEVSAWQGLAAPKGTPADIINTLNKEINAALADPALKARLLDLGTVPLPGSPADFGKLVALDTEKWAKVIKTAGIKAD
jgi:tripartite-type tricarboxylate transporter receptor subunit TctC